MSLRIENLVVNYGSVRALDGVSLTLERGEMFFLLGPSGCGKSTLLRSVAGFIEDFQGDIRIQDQSLKGVPAHKRDFGMVFQNYALFPHLTVEGNVAFGLEARSVPAPERTRRVAEALQLVGLADYGARRPGELSGGQQQRVALSRALVIAPRVLLLDEPLSNLDAKLRWEMREEIRRIHRRTQLTTLYVTHDQKEALALADRMAILREGRIDALGAPRDLYRHPPTRFSAQFLGDINELPGTVSADGRSVKNNWGEVAIPSSLPGGVTPNGPAIVFCRPESVRIFAAETTPAPSDDLHWIDAPGRIAAGAFLGEHTMYEVDLPGGVRWRASRHEAGAGLAEDSAVRIAVVRNGWSVLPATK